MFLSDLEHSRVWSLQKKTWLDLVPPFGTEKWSGSWTIILTFFSSIFLLGGSWAVWHFLNFGNRTIYLKMDNGQMDNVQIFVSLWLLKSLCETMKSKYTNCIFICRCINANPRLSSGYCYSSKWILFIGLQHQFIRFWPFYGNLTNNQYNFQIVRSIAFYGMPFLLALRMVSRPSIQNLGKLAYKLK